MRHRSPNRFISSQQAKLLVKYDMRTVRTNSERIVSLQIHVPPSWVEITRIHLPILNNELAYWVFLGTRQRATIHALGLEGARELARREARELQHRLRQASKNAIADEQRRRSSR